MATPFDKLIVALGNLWRSRGGRRKAAQALGGGAAVERELEQTFGPAGGERTTAETAPRFTTDTSGDRGPPMGTFHRTPGSSNVWGFSFVPDSSKRSGTLYVTFLRNSFHPGSLKRPSEMKVQVHGKRGGTVSGKQQAPGAQYAYFDVPATVYQRFLRANSAGKFVWDELRVRGTIYGHQYRYQLVAGVIDTATGGLYIPRKASPKGFVKRSLAAQGTGKRGFVTSSLGTERFTTRKTGLHRPGQHESLGFGARRIR